MVNGASPRCDHAAAVLKMRELVHKIRPALAIPVQKQQNLAAALFTVK